MKKESFFFAISKVSFQGKGRTNSQIDAETIQNEKKRKGFEKKLLVAIPKDRGHFSRQRKDTSKWRREGNQRQWKKLNGEKRELQFSGQNNDDQFEKKHAFQSLAS